MSDKNILAKLKKRRFYLNKVTAKRIDKEPDENPININHEVACTILKNSKDKLSIKVNTKTYPQPEALFSIEIEYIMEFILKEEITDEEIKNNIDIMVAPLGGAVSYIIASITKEMHGSPLILPPTIEVDKVDRVNNSKNDQS